jgi:hypothetical protein
VWRKLQQSFCWNLYSSFVTPHWINDKAKATVPDPLPPPES